MFVWHQALLQAVLYAFDNAHARVAVWWACNDQFTMLEPLGLVYSCCICLYLERRLRFLTARSREKSEAWFYLAPKCWTVVFDVIP